MGLGALMWLWPQLPSIPRPGLRRTTTGQASHAGYHALYPVTPPPRPQTLEVGLVPEPRAATLRPKSSPGVALLGRSPEIPDRSSLLRT